MIQKVDVLLMSRGMTQGAAEKAVGLAAGRISKWKDRQGEPTALQALKLARLLKVPVEWLIDPETGPDPPLPDPDEAFVLRAMRALRLDPEEAVRRLTREPSPLDAYAPGEEIPLVPGREVELNPRLPRASGPPRPRREGNDERPDPPAAPLTRKR